MATKWRITDLSVNPPSYQLSDTDRVALSFAANGPIAGASAVLTDLGTGLVQPASVESVTIAGQNVIVTVFGLTRGETYELAVTFTRADTTAWTRTLVLECVA